MIVVREAAVGAVLGQGFFSVVLPPHPHTLHSLIHSSPQTSSDPELFVLHPQPVELNYNEFERLLLGIAWHVYITKKKGEAFEEYLGEMLDSIFKKAGILIEVEKDKVDADE